MTLLKFPYVLNAVFRIKRKADNPEVLSGFSKLGKRGCSKNVP
jgi:hypothetical protein